MKNVWRIAIIACFCVVAPFLFSLAFNSEIGIFIQKQPIKAGGSLLIVQTLGVLANAFIAATVALLLTVPLVFLVRTPSAGTAALLTAFIVVERWDVWVDAPYDVNRFGILVGSIFLFLVFFLTSWCAATLLNRRTKTPADRQCLDSGQPLDKDDP